MTLYKYDVAANEWSIVAVQGNTPPYYTGHSMVHVKGFLWLYGEGTLWVLNPKEGIWRDVGEQVRGGSPPIRIYHGCTVADDRLYVFGGTSPRGTQYYSDLWVLDAVRGQLHPEAELVWTELSGALLGSAPSRRKKFGMTALGGRIHIFAGQVSGTGTTVADLHAFTLPRRTPWPSVENFVVETASLYDWDTLVLHGGGADSIPGGDLFLCRDGMPCHLRVLGPGKISARATFSVFCRDFEGCTGMEFESVDVPGEEDVHGFSLQLSGAPLVVFKSTFSGAAVTVGAAALDVISSTFVDCNFVVERGAGLSVSLSTFSGSASSTMPALYLYSGTSAAIESSKFENLHSTSSGAALLVGHPKA